MEGIPDQQGMQRHELSGHAGVAQLHKHCRLLVDPHGLHPACRCGLLDVEPQALELSQRIEN